MYRPASSLVGPNNNNDQALSTLSSLLGVEEAKIESMLTQRVVNSPTGEVFIKQLSVPEADFTRGAIVKSLYEVACPSHPSPIRDIPK